MILVLRVISKLIVFIIEIYQILISPFLGYNCRFYPSCSQYAKIAYSRFGLWQGSKLTVLRLFKCHPWHTGGVDEVPKCNNK